MEVVAMETVVMAVVWAVALMGETQDIQPVPYPLALVIMAVMVDMVAVMEVAVA
jgi:hypothetical protein